ncbi:hypothetical protein LRS05_12015 [Flavobacterium sp. J372]|uniref:hypothetical protein n=1 Tax=Flavobacterium sp. J372 TaxID=2898436 RepID=UPI002150E7B2|nr:hypothetical protein [Flavobacterium sp. J372]MCR5862814.1 hypothetical protein [Flavobacterium sp. J372]
MQRNIISGIIKTPQQPKQRTLHKQLGEFADWMQRPKDANEIRKDKLKAVPIAMLSMVF